MTDRKFEYDRSLLTSCASSRLATLSSLQRKSVGASSVDAAVRRDKSNDDEEAEASCRRLFELHAAHYGRSQQSLLAEDDDVIMKRRLDRFVQNVVLVHQHNNNIKEINNNSEDINSSSRSSSGRRLHEVTLNQFSDLEAEELPLMDSDEVSFFDEEYDTIWGQAAAVEEEAKEGREEGEMQRTVEMETEDGRVLFTLLTDERSILDAAAHGMRSPFPHLHNQQHHQKDTKQHQQQHKHNWNKAQQQNEKEDEMNEDEKFDIEYVTKPFDWESPFENVDNNSSSWHLLTKTKGYHHHHHKNKKNEKKKAHALIIKERKRKVASSEYDSGGSGWDIANAADDNNFMTDLNWDTTNNPDGVPIVNPVFDQGHCGSCWAIAATGTLEASASRKEAFNVFSSTVYQYTGKPYNDDQSNNNNNVPDPIRTIAVHNAQSAERQAFNVANLSVQELIDCDTEYDQGCIGGNPLLAFYFIHKYGLASTARYPYVGYQDRCHMKRMSDPIASVASWGILTPNHEDNMALVLRYIGPIAVGVHGNDPTLLAYHGGIFHSEDCGQDINHALLIVGYGEEINDVNGEKTKYWIARNSWGSGWGEDGYVRLRRGSGRKGHKGVCGIAKSPSVALGGILLPTAYDAVTSKNNNINGWRTTAAATAAASRSSVDDSDDSKEPLGQVKRTYCTNLGFETQNKCNKIVGTMHQHSTLLLTSSILVTVAFLSWRFFVFHSQLRRFREAYANNRVDRTTATADEETSGLLPNASGGTSYGSNEGTRSEQGLL